MLSNNDRTVTCSADSDDGVLGEVRSNRFSVRVDETHDGEDIFLGFHNGNVINWEESSDIHRMRGGYYFAPDSGCKIQGGVFSPYCAGAPITAGDLFTVIKEGRSISFEKNGISLGVAFTDAPEGDMFPTVELLYENDQVTLL